MNEPNISVIIPTFNEEKRLGDLLVYLKKIPRIQFLHLILEHP